MVPYRPSTSPDLYDYPSTADVDTTATSEYEWAPKYPYHSVPPTQCLYVAHRRNNIVSRFEQVHPPPKRGLKSYPLSKLGELTFEPSNEGLRRAVLGSDQAAFIRQWVLSSLPAVSPHQARNLMSYHGTAHLVEWVHYLLGDPPWLAPL